MARLFASPLKWAVRLVGGGLLIGFVSACGLLGSGDGDDQKFPDPPDRPSVVQTSSEAPPDGAGAAPSPHGDRP